MKNQCTRLTGNVILIKKEDFLGYDEQTGKIYFEPIPKDIKERVRTMKETELRIGNLVYFYDELDIITELGQSNNGFCEKSGYFNFDSDCLKPIPITEEWLLRFGFIIKESREKIMFSNENFTKTINIFGGEDNDWGVQLIDKYKDKTESFVLQNGIQYIHELQNLYFALTNKDLEIKN